MENITTFMKGIDEATREKEDASAAIVSFRDARKKKSTSSRINSKARNTHLHKKRTLTCFLLSSSLGIHFDCNAEFAAGPKHRARQRFVFGPFQVDGYSNSPVCPATIPLQLSLIYSFTEDLARPSFSPEVLYHEQRNGRSRLISGGRRHVSGTRRPDLVNFPKRHSTMESTSTLTCPAHASITATK